MATAGVAAVGSGSHHALSRAGVVPYSATVGLNSPSTARKVGRTNRELGLALWLPQAGGRSFQSGKSSWSGTFAQSLKNTKNEIPPSVRTRMQASS